jgi:hypothetical protein
MSNTFNSIKGYRNPINLGDSSYNGDTFNKNNILSNGNPHNWNGNHNIQKESGQSIHTRYIQKVGSEVINEMNRNNDDFSDRMNQNISLYPKNKNIMATGIDYGGSSPYKIGKNGQGSAVASCDFDISEYVTNMTQKEFPLSRIPVSGVETFTNRNDSTHPLSNSYLQPDINNLKSIKDEYLYVNVNSNKISHEHYINNNPDLKLLDSTIVDQKLQSNISSNKYLTNNFSNNTNNNDKIPINENYQNIYTNTNLKSQNTISKHRDLDHSNNIKFGTPLLANITTNKHLISKHVDNSNRNVELYKDKMNTNIETNKISSQQKDNDNRNVVLSRNPLNAQAHTNIQKNPNEVDLQRQKIELSKNLPEHQIQTNIVRKSNHMEQFRDRSVNLPETLNINNNYSNQGIGPRAQNKNVEFNL